MSDYTISKHAKERYAERIMEKDSAYDVNKFIVDNEEKIIVDINKMIQYGTLIHCGKMYNKDGKQTNNNIEVHLNGLWIILSDPKSHNVITLFKIDLGVDEEFHKLYISKMLDKLNTTKHDLLKAKEEVIKDNEDWRLKILENTTQINEYKNYIKNLENLNDAYKSMIDNNSIMVAKQEQEIIHIINTMIGKKTF